jgi:putative phosphonate metabolism protein
MEEFVRYAVYAAPQPGPLAEFAAGWLGWDPQAGVARPHPQLAGLPAPVATLTATPRKYGFHGTLKPPFRLADSTSRAALEADLADLAAGLPAVTLEGLALHRLGGFLALTPEGDSRALVRLAAEVVMGLDQHRAPAGEDELARRRDAGLSPAQHGNLTRWGYPYVLDEFRFHFTLTGKLAPGEAQAVEAALAPVLAPLVPRPFPVEALVLFGEDTAGMFHILHRYALTG